MKRWNGWGNINTHYLLSQSSLHYLQKRIDRGVQTSDVKLEDVISSIPDSRLSHHALIRIDPEDRLRHARGQSLPDWIALRSGNIDAYPDGIAYPSTDADVQELFKFAFANNIHLIPYGGGTSVVGHINPSRGENPTITIDLSNFNQIISIDKVSHLATIEAGIRGPQLEHLLRKEGFTLGHYPQSFEYSTLGGWIATRSNGQQSYYYGRIEDTFAGGHIESPAGPIDINPVPASAAGPDLKQIILGSEGRYGVITRASMRVRTLPEVEGFFAAFFRDWDSGISAVRTLSQSGANLSMLRLSDAIETETTLALSGKDKLVTWAGRGLRVLGFGSNRCLLVYGVTGNNKRVKLALEQSSSTIRSQGGLVAGKMIGTQWQKSRFLTPYLRNTLWENGYVIDTLETAVPWNKITNLASAIKDAIVNKAENLGAKVLVFAHLSHVYNDGASIYVTYIMPRLSSGDELLSHWNSMKTSASQVILSHGGTISHQHGIGQDHLPFLKAEKGEIGIDILRNIRKICDPDAILNPHVLFMNSDQSRMD
ncbi:MAG: FAD-binding oxidoreductase [Anaerolineales bacterium]|nr:FAD-binding oxidoreductase [Anaerolineales bacterium]